VASFLIPCKASASNDLLSATSSTSLGGGSAAGSRLQKPDRMRKNVIPVIIAFSPGLLLPLIQDVMRPRIAHSGLLAFALSWAPDFVVGFCFPFSILIKPRAWTNRGAAKLFALWSALTLVALLLVEFVSPFGPNVFDPRDILAGIGGVALALMVFYAFLRERLTFRDERAVRAL